MILLIKQLFATAFGIVGMTVVMMGIKKSFPGLDQFQALFIGLGIIFVTFIILKVISAILYGSFDFRNRLAIKIMTCPLRQHYGLNYCADCPDGWECATGEK